MSFEEKFPEINLNNLEDNADNEFMIYLRDKEQYYWSEEVIEQFCLDRSWVIQQIKEWAESYGAVPCLESWCKSRNNSQKQYCFNCKKLNELLERLEK